MKLRHVRSLACRLALLFCALPLLAATVAPALRQVALIDLAGSPGFGQATLAHGMLLISHGGAGTVDLFDVTKRRVVGHVEQMSSPRGIAVDTGNKLVYIANSAANNIVAVSSVDWQVKRIIPVHSSPESLLLLPDEQLLYVTFPDSNGIAALDLASNAPATESSLDGRPNQFAWDAKRHQLYLTLQDRRSVVVLTPALKETARWQLNASEPTGIAYSPRLDRLFVAVRYAVLALDADSGKELARTPVSGGIDQLVLDDPTGSLLGAAEGSVFVLPAVPTLGPASEFLTDVKAHTLAYDATTQMVYLPGGREGRSKLLILKRIR